MDRRFRLWRQHAMSVSDVARHQSRGVVFEEYVELGYNYRMTDIQAAVGRVQLRRLPQAVARRRDLAARYTRALSVIPGLVVPVESEWARSNWQSYCVRLPEGVGQRAVMERMLAMGVSTRRGIMCAHREPAFRVSPWHCGQERNSCACPPSTCARLHRSEACQDRCLILPLYHQMTDEETALVIEALRGACCEECER